MILTESQRTLVALSLRVAGEKFTKNAKYLSTMTGFVHLQEQFELQASQAAELATLIDNAKALEVKE